ncbi:MAG: hypothetical protein SPL08_05235 [Pseudomonadota bacterium]|nr:hypothetical protein [Pseudomonadota bacterium]
MVNNFVSAPKKFTNQEIISALSFLDEVGKLSDEALEKRGLKIGDTQKINHFLSAVGLRETTCLIKQATTLLRLTPLLIKGGSNTVHLVLLNMTPRVIEAYQNAPDLDTKRSLAQVIKTAGMVCISPKLGPTMRDRRETEFQMFCPFIGETPAFREAYDRFIKRGRVSQTLIASAAAQSPNAVRIYHMGIRPRRTYD